MAWIRGWALTAWTLGCITACNGGTVVSDAGTDGAARDDGGAGDAGAAPQDTGAPADAGPPTTTPGVVPVINAGMKVRLRGVLQVGAARGNHANIFAKVGDSITASDAFLGDLGCNIVTFGPHGGLRPVLDFYLGGHLPPDTTQADCGQSNSFDVVSHASTSGWTTEDVLGPIDTPTPGCTGADATPLRCEIALLHPAVALVMLGTNDLERLNDTARYRTGLQAIVDTAVGSGVIPVLSTIPPRTDDPMLGARVPMYNAVIVDVASQNNLPLWDFYRAMTTPGLVHGGLSDDGVHPNLYGNCMPPIGCDATDFTSAGLQYGYNLRNLTALQTLAHLKAVVLDDGPADP